MHLPRLHIAALCPDSDEHRTRDRNNYIISNDHNLVSMSTGYVAAFFIYFSCFLCKQPCISSGDCEEAIGTPGAAIRIKINIHRCKLILAMQLRRLRFPISFAYLVFFHI